MSGLFRPRATNRKARSFCRVRGSSKTTLMRRPQSAPNSAPRTRPVQGSMSSHLCRAVVKVIVAVLPVRLASPTGTVATRLDPRTIVYTTYCPAGIVRGRVRLDSRIVEAPPHTSRLQTRAIFADVGNGPNLVGTGQWRRIQRWEACQPHPLAEEEETLGLSA